MPIIRCANAHALLEQLHLVQTIHGYGTWIFRGQALASWRLEPSLFRQRMNAEDEQEFEGEMLKTLHSALRSRTTIPSRLVDDPDYQRALAQHYGAPTRFLDWSLSPLHGAYFAAAGCIRKRSKEPMAIFATAEDPSRRSPNGSVVVVFPNVGGNENLAAQRGILMQYEWSCRDLWHSMHEVEAPDARASVNAEPVSRLIRFELGPQHAWPLLDELARRGVDASTVFPGPHGLVQHAADRAELLRWKNE